MTDLPQQDKETYLGDGLYVSFDGWYVKLRAPRENGDHFVGLESETFQSLQRWIAKHPRLKTFLEGTRRTTRPGSRRKHRLHIDVTVSAPMTRRTAAKALQLVLDNRLDLAAKPIWAYDGSPYVDKLTIVEPKGAPE